MTNSIGVASIASWEYDEVTDVSEDNQLVSQVLNLTHKSNEEGSSSELNDNPVQEFRATPALGSLVKETKKIAGTISAADHFEMETVDETDFDPDMEEKGGGATPSNLQEGQIGPSSSSGGGETGSIGEGAKEEIEDGNEVDLLENEDDDVYPPGPSHAPPPPHLAPTSPHHQNHSHYDMGGSQGDETDEDGIAETTGLSEMGGGMGGPGQPLPLAHAAAPPGGDDDDEIDDDEDEDGQAPAPEGAYDPADYEHLNVSPEIEELFSYITRYTPQAIELEHRLRPYVPDYIPAVGDIDAFIKIPPPDDRPTLVGLEVLDEPSAKQSDPTVLDLQLRALAKHTTAKSVAVKTIANAEKNVKVIEKWVRDISDLHRAKPPPTVHYSKRMPDIDSLMQEWPGEVEDLLKEINLPTAALDMELSEYVDIICATLDIPVYKSRIQSLHVLFTLYSVFKNSQHFRQLAEENYLENDDSGAEHLILQ